MIESQLLAASLQSREAMPSLLSLSTSSTNLVTRTVLREAYEYLSRDPLAARVDPEMLLSLCSTKLAPNQMEQAKLLVERAQAVTSVPNAVALDASLRKNKWGDELLAALGAPSRDWDKISDLCQALPQSNASKLEALGFDEAMEEEEGFAKFNIPELDAKLGMGLKGGNTVLVYGRPEMGKSLLAINLAKGLAEQGLRGIYFENEEPASTTRMRFLCSIANCTRSQLPHIKNKKPLQEVADRIVVHPLTPGTLGEIEALSRGFDWVVVNQLRNLNYRDSNKVVALEELAKGNRTIAARNNLISIMVSQAGDSAEGKRILTMGDVDFSNTGIPAAMDLMIGIGADKDLLDNHYRCLSLPKNKIGTTHDSVLVKIDPYKSLVLA